MCGLSQKVAAAMLLLACGRPALCATELRTSARQETAPMYVPLEHDGKHFIGGLCIDILRAIEKVAPDLRFVGDQQWVPVGRVDVGVTYGKLDVACGVLRTASREQKFVFVEPALFTLRYYLVARADDDVAVRNWDDVRKLGADGTMLLVHGYGMLEKLMPEGLHVDANARDVRSNLMKLAIGRARFYLHRDPGLRAEMVKAGVQGKLRVLPEAMESADFHMVIAKSVPQPVRDRVQDAIACLERSGELARLYRKWSGS